MEIIDINNKIKQLKDEIKELLKIKRKRLSFIKKGKSLVIGNNEKKIKKRKIIDDFEMDSNLNESLSDSNDDKKENNKNSVYQITKKENIITENIDLHTQIVSYKDEEE